MCVCKCLCFTFIHSLSPNSAIETWKCGNIQTFTITNAFNYTFIHSNISNVCINFAVPGTWSWRTPGKKLSWRFCPMHLPVTRQENDRAPIPCAVRVFHFSQIFLQHIPKTQFPFKYLYTWTTLENWSLTPGNALLDFLFDSNYNKAKPRGKSTTTEFLFYDPFDHRSFLQKNNQTGGLSF